MSSCYHVFPIFFLFTVSVRHCDMVQDLFLPPVLKCYCSACMKDYGFAAVKHHSVNQKFTFLYLLSRDCMSYSFFLFIRPFLLSM